MNGIILVDKPLAVSSSNAVCKVKKLTHEKCGHLGTLDPLATGVLPICIGRATKLFDYFISKQKTYIAHFKFGEETDTLDLEGKVTAKSDYIPTKIEIENAIKNNFLGNISQLPPQYSAKKINGQKAYDLARKNKEINLKPAVVTIFSFEIIRQIDKYTFEFEIVCSAGTYIRSLARDLAKECHSVATMVFLRRTKVANFSLENCLNFDLLTYENISQNILPLENILANFEKINLTNSQLKNLLDGKKFLTQKNDGLYCAYCDNKVVGIGQVEQNILKIKTYLI